jgi:hypothetical protein
MFVHFECGLKFLGEKKKKSCLAALKIFPMLGETSNQFYMSSDIDGFGMTVMVVGMSAPSYRSTS